MRNSDVDEVVAVHIKSFPDFFLSFLGSPFLSLYYMGIGSSPDGICFVYRDSEGKLVGFVAGSVNPRGFYSNLLKKDWFRFSLASLRAIFKKPSIFLRIVRSVSFPDQNPGGHDISGLYSLGVVPGNQGKGVGWKLVDAFLDEAAKRGCNEVFLTTDRDENEKVNNFYKRMGFEIRRQYETPENRKMNEYRIDLTGRLRVRE